MTIFQAIIIPLGIWLCGYTFGYINSLSKRIEDEYGKGYSDGYDAGYENGFDTVNVLEDFDD